ncbi:MAG TPA: AAA family ATPase, partial [Firmicutes bacterium]|nr:AAA family ATPase [Bacillota bacterium]
MARKGGNRRSIAIVTFPGEDGASAAALLLAAKRGAQVFLSSKSAIARTLADLAGRRWQKVHICGVGIPSEGMREVLDALKKMRALGTETIWYCGYDYLDEFRPALEPYCECRFTSNGMPIPELILRVLYPADTEEEHPNRIRFVGTKYAVKEAVPSKYRARWAEIEQLKTLVRASIRRWINFEDEEAFPHMVRVLAEAEPMTSQDRKMIRLFEGQKTTYLRGRSRAIREIRKLIQKCGPTESPVLISGETGTGKEIIAKLIHESSRRVENLFACVNCANLEGTLLQDRLFGHRKGAYTGADSDKPGLFELANGGTLFLDEVGEMPLATQAQLLRVIQEGEFLPLGDETPRQTDVRIIAATNRDLLRGVEEKSFREDLYYRLAVIPILLPPLRERKEDIPILAQHILFDCCKERGTARVQLSQKQEEELQKHSWPGNVRELENVLQRFVILGTNDIAKCIEQREVTHLEEEDVIPLEEYTRNYIR